MGCEAKWKLSSVLWAYSKESFRVPMGLLGKRYQRLDFWRETRWQGVIDRRTATPHKCKLKHDQGLESAPVTLNIASEVGSKAWRISGGDRCYSNIKSVLKISGKQQLETPRNVYNLSGKLCLKIMLICFIVDMTVAPSTKEEHNKETGSALLVKINRGSYHKPTVFRALGTRHRRKVRMTMHGQSVIHLCQTYLRAQFQGYVTRNISVSSSRNKLWI